MDYPQAISQLLTLVDLERNRVSGPRQKAIYNLERMGAFLERLGSPEKRVPTIHVAGTKGKGSTAAMCDAALEAAGLRTGFYSSPHLHSFTERIRRDAKPISEDTFAGLVAELWPARNALPDAPQDDAVTLFEFMTGMAFHLFAKDQVDVQTIEVGLGGRLDATNVVDAAVSVITSVSLDHMSVLGNTVGEIAADKAGIIKPGGIVVVAPQSPEALTPILAAAERAEAQVILVGRDVTWEPGESDLNGQRFRVQGRKATYDLQVPLLGAYQLENAATAVAALEAIADVQGLSVGTVDISCGFRDVSWPCRMEVLSRQPLLVADGAHNVYSIQSLLAALPKYLDFGQLILVAGISRDKNVPEMVEELAASADRVFVAASRHPRSVPTLELAGLFEEAGKSAVLAATPGEALEQARAVAGPNDLVLATGSLFLAAEVREAALGIKPEIYPELMPPRDPR